MGAFQLCKITRININQQFQDYNRENSITAKIYTCADWLLTYKKPVIG